MKNDKRNQEIREQLEGKIFVTNEGYDIKVIKYINHTNIIIEFLDEYHFTTSVRINKLKDGGISNPYHRSVLGVGYLGVGKHKCWENGKHTKKYDCWIRMVSRCYDDKLKETRLDYLKNSMCEEWLNFQNFGDLYDDNYYTIEGETMNLDKDILVKGNSLYSPSTCCFVPNKINNAFKGHTTKNKTLPVGVRYDKKKNNYFSFTMDYEKNYQRVYGHFTTPEEAHEDYIIHKRENIIWLANKYKELIPEKVYNAMVNYY